MGTRAESSSELLLRELAARQGVEPTDDDLAAVRAFLDILLPALSALEERLAAQAT
jgi:hypothetical protein